MANRLEILRPFEEKKDYMEARVKSGIELNRKGNARIRVFDAEGRPVQGAHITLKQTSHEFLHGANIFMLKQMPTPETNRMYEDFFCRAFNLATIPFYWCDLEPEQGRPRFAADSPNVYRRPAPDLCVDFCEKNGITPKLHCLDYDKFTPRWVPDDLRSVRRLLTKRMREIAERYADRIPGVEVTNEYLLPMLEESARHSTAQYMAPDCVEWSFETARRFFPANELIINEATGPVWDQFQYNRSAYYMMIERALSKGAPIDTVGMQFHMFVREEEERERAALRYDPEHIFDVLDRYSDFGRPIQITEVTLSAYHQTEEDEYVQAEVLKNLYRMWFSHKNVEAIIYWNTVDGFAYVNPEYKKRDENYYMGGLIRHDFTPKPAYNALVDLFTKEWHTETETVTDEDGAAFARGFYGDYDAEITAGGKTVKMKLSIKKDATNLYRVSI